jgi:hypothetical protein
MDRQHWDRFFMEFFGYYLSVLPVYISLPVLSSFGALPPARFKSTIEDK